MVEGAKVNGRPWVPFCDGSLCTRHLCFLEIKLFQAYISVVNAQTHVWVLLAQYYIMVV